MKNGLSMEYLQDSVPNCSGCGACLNACPTNSIYMKDNGTGFRYPFINSETCIGCRKCEKVCPVLNKQVRGFNAKQKNSIPHAYGGWILDEEVRLKSSSGGIFSALATYVINKKGSVYGASMGTDLKIKHIRISEVGQIALLRGSKYRQSDIGTVYRDVLKDLKSGAPVLFSGVPCQIGGLLSYLGKPYDNLLTIDIVCHGVPSDHLFNAYVQWQEELYRDQVVNIDFRNKSTGWSRYSIVINFNSGKTNSFQQMKDPFMGGFMLNGCLRKSCYECLYHRIPRLADITLGDFWGVANVAPHLNDDKGVSLIIPHTEKGENILHEVEQIYIQSVNYREAVAINMLTPEFETQQ